MRDLTFNEKRIFLAALVLIDVFFAVNYYAGLGLVSSGPRETMVVAWALTVVLALYMDPRPDTQTILPLEAGCAMCGQEFAKAEMAGRLEIRRGPREFWRAPVHVRCLRAALRPDVTATLDRAGVGRLEREPPHGPHES